MTAIAQASPRKIAAHDRSGVMILSLGMSELGLHIRDHKSSTHFLFRIKTFDSFAK